MVDRRVEFSLNSLQIIILSSSVMIILVLTFAMGVMVGKRTTGSTSFLEKDIKSQVVKMKIEAPPASQPSVETATGEAESPVIENAASKPVMTFYDTLTSPKKRTHEAAASVNLEETRKPPAETGNPRKKYTIQVGAMKEKESADAMISKLKKSGYSAYVTSPGSSGKTGLYKVRLGTFPSRDDALKEADRIKKNEGLSTMVVEK